MKTKLELRKQQIASLDGKKNNAKADPGEYTPLMTLLTFLTTIL
ncbi:MAG: hypothetical protein ACEPOV_13330 [Hyphomicrobiales bacterium]